MSEPWQDDSPEPGAGQAGARFVCRVSGAPADPVDELRAARTLELLARLAEVEDRLHERRETVSQLLFEAIGAATEKPLRNRLITLKRELYNLRPLSREKTDEALALLPADASSEVGAFAADLAERGRIDAELRETYAREAAELRGRFRSLLDDADFRKGLMISSRSLYASLPRYREAKGELSGKDEKTERGLLRYYTRMAMKATPFSTFCAIISGTFTEPDGGGALLRFEGDPREKTSYVRINKLLYGILLDHLKERQAVRHALQVELNPTLREEKGRLVYLTAIQSREVFQRMANNEVLELIINSFRGLGKPTLGELIGALASDPQIEASPEEAEAYLDKLIEIGFLRFHTGIREQDADWDHPFRALLGRIDDDHARQSAELLVKVREATEAYATAGVEERARLIEEMHALINAAIEAMEIKGRLRRDMPFYEDATSPARAAVPLTDGVRRTLGLFQEWARLTSRVAWPRGEQATMRHFFDTYYGEAKSVPLLVFYEDFYREHFKAHVEKEAKLRAGVDREQLQGYNVGNPFELDFIKRLGEARDRLGETIRERWKADPGAEEITIAAADVERALEGVETTSGVVRSMGSFVTLSPGADGGDPVMVLQGGSYTAGYGKYFSRFLYMLPDEMQEQVRRENAALTGEYLAEICGDAQFNANLHPPLLRWEISYPTGESGAAEEQLRSSDIFVEPDPEDQSTLRLRHGPSGRRVVPVDLGFLNPRMRPPLYQLLSRFTPPVTFGPNIPESPEPPRRAEPKPDVGAQAEADVQAEVEAKVEAAPRVGPPDAEGPAPDVAAAPVAVEPAPAEAGADAAPAAAGAPAEGASAGPPPPAPPPPTVQVRPRVTYGGSLVLSRRRWLVPKPLFPQREAHESAADFFVRANRWRLEHGIPETCYVRIMPLPDPPQPKPGQPAQAAAEEQPQPAMEAELPGYDAPVAEGADEHEEHDEHEEEQAPAAVAEGEGGEAQAEGEAKAEGEAGGEAKQPPKPRTQGSRDLHKPQFMDFGNPLLVGLLGKMAANLKNYSVNFEERLPGREALARDGSGASFATELVVQVHFPAGTASPAGALSGEGDHAGVA